MDSHSIRKTFFEFFRNKGHHIVESAPMVLKNDPTLMFTNAGMNQFKDIFLGNSPAKHPRVADTQKCLRVSGKHNDLEEVGMDTYHHTMFEMLGNWSFGDYFKKEAIAWAWEFLTNVHKIDKDRLYATVFGGDKSDNLEIDHEAYEIWGRYLPAERILYGSKKDNFWEMGETGPCGPCSEIHIDIRNDEQRKKIDGKELVNKDHPLVIEIWNLVFIQYNRMADSSLVNLPQKHVDTGMGFERLCMVLQEKTSNYDTDIFQNLIKEIEKLSGFVYGKDKQTDIAMRVISDHLRAVSFAIADGQLPSNNKAGYVIRRILRRAVRYGYTFLGFKEPFINEMVPALVKQMGSTFQELKSQETLIKKVITEEELAFLKTLETGIQKFEQYLQEHPKEKIIDGKFAFELFDTYGFPLDLTELMAREKGWTLDRKSFEENMAKQKERSRKDAKISTEDWQIIQEGKDKTEFVGYDHVEAQVNILRYRKVNKKGKDFYHLVFDRSPFYAEAGGQVGDRGYIENSSEKIFIEDTQRENELIIHITKKLPEKIEEEFKAVVDLEKRIKTTNNHTSTHLLHAALRKVVGGHVEQKGSLVDDKRLRFDFSHFSKVSEEEIREIDKTVNKKIRENIPITEHRQIAMKEAQNMGAVALFGEKYGDEVRVVAFDKDYSVELCGGTHVKATGQIGLFKIVSESAIAAGVRRIEAVTADKAEELFYTQLDTIKEINAHFKSTKDVVKSVKALIDENNKLQKEIEAMNKEKAGQMEEVLKKNIKQVDGVNFIAAKVNLEMPAIKNLVFAMKKKVDHLVMVLGSENNGKANLTVAISDDLVNEKGMNAGKIIKELAKEIQGGGGGQPFFATAGGRNPQGIGKALEKAEELLK